MNIRFATQEDTPYILMMYRELFKEMSLLQPNYLREANQDPNFIIRRLLKARRVSCLSPRMQRKKSVVLVWCFIRLPHPTVV